MQLKQGGTFTRLFFLGGTGLTPNVTVNKAGAGFAAPTNGIVEIANGWYKLDLVGADLDTLGQLAYHLDAGTPADFEDQVFAQVLGDDLKANVQQWLNQAVSVDAGNFPRVHVITMAGNAITTGVLSSSAIADIWHSVPLAEVYAADGAVATPAQLLYMLWSALTEFVISGGTLTCKGLDGTTPVMAFTLSPAGNPTSRTRST